MNEWEDTTHVHITSLDHESVYESRLSLKKACGSRSPGLQCRNGRAYYSLVVPYWKPRSPRWRSAVARRGRCSGRGLAPLWRCVSVTCTASSPRPPWGPDFVCNAPGKQHVWREGVKLDCFTSKTGTEDGSMFYPTRWLYLTVFSIPDQHVAIWPGYQKTSWLICFQVQWKQNHTTHLHTDLTRLLIITEEPTKLYILFIMLNDAIPAGSGGI